MARGEDWSQLEVDACVADYLAMLTLELNGQRYSKTDHARILLQKLDGRSRPSLEFKHCNISAVLLTLGYPYINGYKPRGNFQSLLLDSVEAQLPANIALHDAAQAAVMRPALVTPASSDIWVPAPPFARHSGIRETPAQYDALRSTVKRDYLAQEARNRSLGRAGELLVLDLETRRLQAAGKRGLSNRVEHVAATRGDGLGYDVLSFENDGRERLIEVKTTTFGKLTPFYVSRNELARSDTDAPNYHLYRLFDFRSKARLFELPGAIRAACALEPVSFLARLAD